MHLTIVTREWGVVVRSCLGVNRINFHMIFDGFYIFVRPINRKTCKNIYNIIKNTDSGSSRPAGSFGDIKIIIRKDYTSQNPLQSINFLHHPGRQPDSSSSSSSSLIAAARCRGAERRRG